MGKHTPGPFEVQDPMGSDVGLWVVQAGLEAYEWSCIAIVCRDDDRTGKHFITKAEQKANADLFAAAPEMLEAGKRLLNYATLEEILTNASRHDDSVFGIRLGDLRTLAAAIAKVEGRS